MANSVIRSRGIRDGRTSVADRKGQAVPIPRASSRPTPASRLEALAAALRSAVGLRPGADLGREALQSLVDSVAEPDRRYLIIRILPDGSHAEVVAQGVAPGTAAAPHAPGDRIPIAGSPLEAVLATGAAVRAPLGEPEDVAGHEIARPSVQEPDAAAQVWVPIRSGEHIAGAVALCEAGEHPRPLDEDDATHAAALAAAAGLLLDADATRRELRRQALHTEVITSFVAAVAVAGSRDEVYRILVDSALRSIRGGIVLYTVSPDGVHLDIAIPDPPQSRVARLARVAARRLRVGEGLAGRAAREGVPVMLTGTSEADRAAYRRSLPPDVLELLEDELPPSGMAVPLVVRGRVIAVLFGSRDTVEADPFDADDLAFVRGLVEWAAVSVERVEREREDALDAERERLRAAAFIGAARAGEHTDDVFRAVVEPLAELGGYAWVQELAPDQEGVKVRAWHVVDPAHRAAISRLLPIGFADARLGSTGQILRTNAPIFIPDEAGMAQSAFMRERVRPADATLVRGVVIVPLRRSGRIIGALGLGHVDPAFRGYTRRDLDFLASLSSAVSILLDNAVAARARDAATRELARTSRLLAAILDASPLATVVLDADQRVTFWNRAAERLYGYPSAAVIGHPPPHLDGDAEAMEALREVSTTPGRNVRVDAMRRHRDGTPVDVVVHAVTMEGPVIGPGGVLVVEEDVTERRRLERELAEAQKMETIGRLAGGVAHDMNNILTAILGYASLSLEITREPEVRAALGTIRESAERAAGLTHQLLAFSRRQVLSPSAVDPDEALRSIVPMLRPLLGERIEVLVEAEPGPGAVLVDRSQLDQVVLNLALNARDAMPEGGHLAFRATRRTVTADDPAGEVPPGEYVVLAVSDTGSGMDEETRRHIFEPFFTTKGTGPGTGLGLATVYGIVRQSGGTIELDTEPGRGTTFRILLPRAGAVAEGTVPAGRDAPAATGRVLVVEDEELLRALAVRILRRDGLTVLSAADAGEALALLRDQPPIDLLVSDVVMPGMSGPDLARRLRQADPDLPVILMSGYAEDLTDTTGIATAFLAKPYPPAALLAAVREALGAHAGRAAAPPRRPDLEAGRGARR